MVSLWEMQHIIEWAAYGMELPRNMLKYGSEVKFRRWHGNYIRCTVKIGDWVYKGASPGFFAPGKIVAAAEFVGNTIRQNRCLILFSEFEAEDWAVWSNGTHAFKRRSDIKYHAFVEIQNWKYGKPESVYSATFNLSQEEVFELAKTALDYVNERVRKQLKLFFENFYFLPRKWEEFANYVDIDKYDCVWVK